jgi:hypothetical protein
MIGLICLDHVLRELGWTVANLGRTCRMRPCPVRGRNDARLAPDRLGSARVATLADGVGAIRAATTGAVRSEVAIMLGGRLAAHPGIGNRRCGLDGGHLGGRQVRGRWVRRLSASET